MGLARFCPSPLKGFLVKKTTLARKRLFAQCACLVACLALHVSSAYAQWNILTLNSDKPIFLSCLAQNHASACSIKLFV